MASSGMLLIAIAFPHWSRLWWQGAFLGALGLAELAWSMAWLRKPSFALIWSGYLLGAYLVPIWSLAWLVGFPDGLPHLRTGFGLAATLLALAAITALIGLAVVARPLMGTWKFLGSAAVPAILFALATYGVGLVIDLLAAEASR
jgi:hypothetical protein